MTGAPSTSNDRSIENGPKPLNRAPSAPNTAQHPTDVAADAAAGPDLVSPPRAPLKQRVLQSGAVSIIGFGAGQVIRLLSNLIMTRLLTADAFGLMAITVSLQVLMIMVSDVGINTSIIRSDESDKPRFLATAFTMQLARGVLIAIVILGVALGVVVLNGRELFNPDTVFVDPRLPVFLVIIALCGLLEGMRSLKMVLCQRDLKMERLVTLEISTQILAVIGMISAFFLGAGAYSLVFGALTATIATTLGSHFFLKGPDIFIGFDRALFGEIFSFGKWLLVASFAGFVTQRGDHFIFGAVMAREDYGYYAIATIWITVALVLSDILQRRIIYTSLAEVWRERKQDLTSVYYQYRTYLDIGYALLFCAVILLSDFAFTILYPDDYGTVTTYLKILAIIILALPYHLLSSVLLAVGESRNFMIMTLFPMVFMLVLTPIMLQLTDLRTAIMFSAFAQFSIVPFCWVNVRRHVRLSPVREVPMIVFAFVAALGLAAI
ncbi:MAG: oligosaccharide flippase family protein [Pseudomonadota bacterium]